MEYLYTATILREAFGDMTILLLAEHDENISEGARHKGMTALIDLVARKCGHSAVCCPSLVSRLNMNFLPSVTPPESNTSH
jgi:hypothetical protein